MKILYLSNMRFPSERAYSRQVVEMCRAFVEIGHEVSLCVNDRETHIKESPEEYYGITFPFTLKILRVPDLIKYGKVGFMLATIAFSIRSFKVVKSEKPDLLYCRNEWILAFLELMYPTQKKVYESHEAKFSILVRFLFRRGIKCITISEGIRNFYLNNNIPGEQLLVAHDGIDESFFGSVETKEQARKRLDLPQDTKIAMYIGGFDAWKGVDTFFKASEEKQDSDLMFVAIGGKTPEVTALQNKYPNVKFLGPRPYSELKDNQQAADVLVIPNTNKNALSSLYTSPLKLFAHLSSKVPLIVSDIQSMRNIVSEKEVYFVASDSKEALIKKIKAILTDQTDTRKRADSAYKLSINFTWKQRSSKIINFVLN